MGNKRMIVLLLVAICVAMLLPATGAGAQYISPVLVTEPMWEPPDEPVPDSIGGYVGDGDIVQETKDRPREHAKHELPIETRWVYAGGPLGWVPVYD